MSREEDMLVRRAAAAYITTTDGEWPTTHSAYIRTEGAKTEYVILRGSRQKLLAIYRVDRWRGQPQVRRTETWPVWVEKKLAAG